MEFKKIANYNIRFVDAINMSPLTIDLTPAEVKESNGKVIYILRTIDNSTYFFCFCAAYDVAAKNISFIELTGDGVGLVNLVAENDNEYYHFAD